MLSFDVLAMQRAQSRHDKRNHSDILSLHKNDRVKHYGLHFAKYAARFNGFYLGGKNQVDNAVDSMLVSLSSANTLNFKLYETVSEITDFEEAVASYQEHAAMYCDGAEKIDHGENFFQILRDANAVLFWCSAFVLASLSNDANCDIEKRRSELGARNFYIED